MDQPATIPSMPPPPRRSLDAGTALLTACAVILGLLIVIVSLRTPTAHAEMVSTAGPLTVMTAEGGNEEILLMLDGRAEHLSVYRVENQSSLELYKRYDLPKVFNEARTRAMGRK
jgi:hypothetical protein